MKSNGSISRRTFLSTAAAAAVFSSARSARSASNALRIGVLGCGVRGIELTRELSARRNEVAIAAVCDACNTRSDYARSLTGADVVLRWQDLIDRRDLDAVVISVPDHLHAPLSIAAMECGKDVYCEKPMTLRLDEAKAFRDTARRTRRIVQIGAVETSEPQWRLAREMILSGAIGAPVWCQGSYSPTDASAPASPASGNMNWRNYWNYSNGIAGEVFFHKLAALLTAVGPAYPERVSAAGGVYAADGREVPDSFVMTAEYSRGLTIVLASSMANRNGVPAIIRGTEGSIEMHGDSIRVFSDVCAGSQAERMRCKTSSLSEHIGDWLNCVRTRGRCVCNEDIGCQAMVASAMAVESYRLGKTLRFDAQRERAVPSGARGSLDVA